MHRRKLLGLFLILNLLNIANLVIPDCHYLNNEGINRSRHAANLVFESIILIITFSTCFCSQIIRPNGITTKCALFVILASQFLMVFLFQKITCTIGPIIQYVSECILVSILGEHDDHVYLHREGGLKQS